MLVKKTKNQTIGIDKNWQMLSALMLFLLSLAIHAQEANTIHSRASYAEKIYLQLDGYYKPDLRSVVHWQPEIKTNSLGKATTTFYNGDLTGEMLIVVEILSENGEIGYQELVYEVDGDWVN